MTPGISDADLTRRLEDIRRFETRFNLKDIIAVGSLLIVLGGGIIALYTQVARVDAKLEAHLTSRETHPTQDERRRVVQEEIDRGLRPVMTQLEAIKMQLTEVQHAQEVSTKAK